MREITDLKEIQQMAFHILTALSAVLIFYHCYLCFIIIEFCLSGRQEGFLYCVLENTVLLNIPLRSGFVDGAHWFVVFILVMNVFFIILSKLPNVMASHWFWSTQHAVFCLASIIGFVYFSSLNSYILFASLVSFGVFFKLYSYALIGKNTFYLVTALQIITIFFSESLDHSFLLIAFLLAVCAAMREKTEKYIQVSDSNALSWIGDRSYHIYLIHQNIGYMVINGMLYVGWPYVSGLLFAVIVAISLGSILYYLEKNVLTGRSAG